METERKLKMSVDEHGNEYWTGVGISMEVTNTETEEQRRIAALEERITTLEAALAGAQAQVTVNMSPYDAKLNAILDSIASSRKFEAIKNRSDEVLTKNKKLMTLKFNVEFPVLDTRFVNAHAETVESSARFFAGVKNFLVSRVHVRELAGKGDKSKLTIRYEEEYSTGATFHDVMKRAEEYARDYCEGIGLGAE